MGFLVVPAASAQTTEAAPSGSSPGDSDEAKARAKALFEKGIDAYKNARYKDAIDSFLDAHRLYPNPVLSFNTARAYQKLGDKAGALRFYREYLRQSPTATDRSEVETEINGLETALRERGVQQVTILSTPEGATVTLDDRPVGVTPWTGEIFPGKHRLKLSREGFKALEQEFDLPAHRAIDVVSELEKAPAGAEPKPAPAAPEALVRPASSLPPDKPRKGIGPLTWTAFGVGAAGLGGALVFELMRRSSEDAVKTEPTQVKRGEAFDQMESRQTTARVLFVVGSVATLAGGVLLYLDLSRSEQVAQPNAIGAACTFDGCGIEYSTAF